LKIGKHKFIDAWPRVKDGIFDAVDYIRLSLRVPVSRLLPYNTLLVPFTYFFVENDGRPPSPTQHKLLVQYFWWASLTNRFSSAVESKLAQDRDRIDSILKEESPDYGGEEPVLTIDSLRRCWFSTGNAFCKAIICLYAYFQPRSFKNDALVNLDNSYLRVANSRNYHHFFPKSYLRKKGFEDWLANSILNITLVDDVLNKHEIRARAPSEYMREYQTANPDFPETMRTHLIDDLDDFGVWRDDYEFFIQSRGKWVLNELNKRLNPKI
jgi:hypothetical protein